MSNKFLSKMLYALTSAYSRKDYDNVQLGLPLETNIGKLFSILAWGLETVEEQAELVRLWDDLDYACGSVLDRYGANFGVKRVSSDDRFYRLAIRVKIMAQLSRGAVQTPTLTSTPPDVKRAHRGRQDGAGGVVYHTHIKSKRID